MQSLFITNLQNTQHGGALPPRHECRGGSAEYRMNEENTAPEEEAGRELGTVVVVTSGKGGRRAEGSSDGATDG